MTDNVIKFPDQELDIEFDPEDELYHDEVVVAVQNSLMFLATGLESSTEADWEHIMDAAVNLSISAGLNCGMTLDDMEVMFNAMQIEKVEYDA